MKVRSLLIVVCLSTLLFACSSGKGDDDNFAETNEATQAAEQQKITAQNVFISIPGPSELSDLITCNAITGMAPYGRGEEVRPNNLTYVLTANTANVSNDIADRSYYIHVRKEIDSEKRLTWEDRIQEYIELHRLEIFSDIIALLQSHKPFVTPTRTRTSAFEARILQPCCITEESYAATVEYMMGSKADSNQEEEQARTMIEIFNHELSLLNIDKDDPAFIRNEVCNSWGRRALQESKDYKGYPIQLIRNFSKTGKMHMVNKEMKRWQSRIGNERHSGVGWNITDYIEQAELIFRDADGIIKHRTIRRSPQCSPDGNQEQNNQEDIPF